MGWKRTTEFQENAHLLQCTSQTHPETFAGVAVAYGEEGRIGQTLQRYVGWPAVTHAFCIGPCAGCESWYSAMTEYAFSKSGRVREWDSDGDFYWDARTFHWGNMHARLTQPLCLPEKLQLGMQGAKNASFWINTMKLLQSYPAPS